MMITTKAEAVEDLARRRYASAQADSPGTFPLAWDDLPEKRKEYAGLCKSGWRDAVAPILEEVWPMLVAARAEAWDECSRSIRYESGEPGEPVEVVGVINPYRVPELANSGRDE